MTNNVTQKNVSADVVGGRDAYKSTHYHYGDGQSGRLKELLAKFWHEYENNIEFREITDELTYYKTPKADGSIVGLENKLTAGLREDRNCSPSSAGGLGGGWGWIGRSAHKV